MLIYFMYSSDNRILQRIFARNIEFDCPVRTSVDVFHLRFYIFLHGNKAGNIYKHGTMIFEISAQVPYRIDYIKCVHSIDKAIRKFPLPLFGVFEPEGKTVCFLSAGIFDIGQLIMILSVRGKYFVCSDIVAWSRKRNNKIFREQILCFHLFGSFRINENISKWSRCKTDIV